jgi:hypothetical protein
MPDLLCNMLKGRVAPNHVDDGGRSGGGGGVSDRGYADVKFHDLMVECAQHHDYHHKQQQHHHHDYAPLVVSWQ